jgi:TolB-like protein/Flp pilus assembly protein TadD
MACRELSRSAASALLHTALSSIAAGGYTWFEPVVNPDLLDSWKAIASYLKRDIRTAQRWERTLRLPVHRVPNSKLVFAYRSELEAWLARQTEVAAEPESLSEPELSHARWNRSVWLSVAALLVALGVFLVWRATNPGPIDSLAVLPFVNVTGDPDTDYLSEGISESLINHLSQVPKLRVAPRSLTFVYKGGQIDPEKAGRDLKVRAVLMGRVTQDGEHLRIQAELVDAAKVSQVWGRQYNSTLAKTIELQEEIARNVAEALHLPARQAKRSTANNEAFQAYMKGRYYWNRRTEKTLKRAVKYFQTAIDLDPACALAYAGLADCFIVYSEYEVEARRESGPKAMVAASKALEIDNSLAEAHAALAFARMQYEWDWAAAERSFQQAIGLDPGYATAHHWYSIFLESTGRTDQAVASARQAQKLDPVSIIISAPLGQALYFAHRYDEAIEEIRKALDMDPNFARGHLFLGMAYEQKQMYPEAVAEIQKAFELSGGSANALGALGHAYAVTGGRAKALKAVGDLTELSKHRYVAPFDIAVIYAGLGERTRAFE